MVNTEVNNKTVKNNDCNLEKSTETVNQDKSTLSDLEIKANGEKSDQNESNSESLRRCSNRTRKPVLRLNYEGRGVISRRRADK